MIPSLNRPWLRRCAQAQRQCMPRHFLKANSYKVSKRNFLKKIKEKPTNKTKQTCIEDLKS